MYKSCHTCRGRLASGLGGAENSPDFKPSHGKRKGLRATTPSRAAGCASGVGSDALRYAVKPTVRTSPWPPFFKAPHCREALANGGRGGIRTHGAFNSTLDFESSALDRTQPPFLLILRD